MESYLPTAKEFINFVDKSPSPYHAVSEISDLLKANGYQYLSEKNVMDIKPNNKYFFTRNQSCIAAFAVGGKFKPGNGFNIAAAHTDSPNFKVRPHSNVESAGYLQVGVETYGGGLWYTWFDRDLTVAGRVIVKVGDQFESKLVHIKKPILKIPSLAIHLDRSVNTDGFKHNAQNHLVPMIASKLSTPIESKDASTTTTSSSSNNNNNNEDITKKHHSVLLELISKELKCQPNDIQTFDLSVCDTQPASIGGALDEFIFSPRCDNLGMSFASIKALISATNDNEKLSNEENVLMTVLFDNEEVGSSSPQGACAPLITDTITRINASFLTRENKESSLMSLVDISTRKSFLISADMAHAVHPNYTSHHEPLHRPSMNKGVVIKYNANLRYATLGTTAFPIIEICKSNQIPYQEFLVKNDSPCGSTIGPIISGGYGIRTVDIGNPQLSMHSIRETCGVADVTFGINLITKFFEQFTNLDKKLTVDLE